VQHLFFVRGEDTLKCFSSQRLEPSDNRTLHMAPGGGPVLAVEAWSGTTFALNDSHQADFPEEAGSACWRH
jgi:hypothetical protein